MEFVVSEIDLGDGDVADSGTQLGSSTISDNGEVVNSSLQVPLQPRSNQQVQADKTTHVAEPTAKSLTDEEVEKLDLGQSENIRQFRNTYEKNKVLLGEAEQQRDVFKQELETLRSSQGRGVYLDTNIPLEDFKPYEGLQRMATEEPEYHDAVVDAVLEAHLWPNIGTEMRKLEGKQLGRVENGALVFDNDDERIQYRQLEQTWDFLARRVAGVDGKTLSGLIAIVAQSPEIGQLIEAKLNGGYAPAIPTSTTGFQAASASQFGQQPSTVGVQSLPQIAQDWGLDLSEPEQARRAQSIQGLQRQAAETQIQAQSEKRTLESQLQQMKSELEGLKGGQQQAQAGTVADAERQAESKVESHLTTALDTEFQEKYANAIPKDRPGLADRIKKLTRENLNENTTFKETRAAAMKWFKQAAGRPAGQEEGKRRDEERGLHAMAVVATLRANAMAEEARELLGKLPAQAAAIRQKTDAAKARRELPGGSTARNPAPAAPATVTGDIDIEGARAAIRNRMKQAGITMT